MSLLSKKTAPKKAVAKSVFSDHWLFTIYLALVSLIAVVVMCVNLGVFITSTGKFLIITDEEYVLSDRAWQVQQCSEPRWNDGKSEEKTPDEIIVCEEKAKTVAIAQRSINLKETFIESLAWFAVFGLLFWFHYPKFLATREKH